MEVEDGNGSARTVSPEQTEPNSETVAATGFCPFQPVPTRAHRSALPLPPPALLLTFVMAAAAPFSDGIGIANLPNQVSYTGLPRPLATAQVLVTRLVEA